MLALFGARQLFDDEQSSESEGDESSPRQCFSYETMILMNEMRENNQLCNARIRTNTGKIFHVHQAILGASSEYFRTLFTTPLNESKEETVLVGVSPEAMERIIRYAYLREVKTVTEANVVETMMTSDYLSVLGLMRFSIEFIIKMLSPTNCVIFWLMSRYRSIPRLVEKSRNYILEHFVRVSVESKQILDLNVDDFYSIINDEMLNVKDEAVVWECAIRWIEFNPNKRKVHLTKLLRGIRLGLLPDKYFMETVKNNCFVKDDPEARPIIVETMRFLCDLETISNASNEILSPPLAVPRLPHEVIFAIGGWSEGAPQAIIETYDTRADRWIRVPAEDPAGPRSYHGTAVIGTKLYCIGGFNGTDYFNTCSRFNADKKTWREIAPMHSRRCYVSVASLHGYIYALGGYDGMSRQNTGERYDPKKNQWTMIAPMNYQRSDADACTMDGKLYITGGFNGQECLNTAEYYTPETNRWTMLPPMLSRRSGVSCVEHQGFIYVIGGFNGISRMNTGERYEPSQNAWTSIKPMYNPRSNFGLEIIDDMILAIGGFNGVVTISHCECYVPETNEWLEATDMTIIRSALTANVVRGLVNIREYVHKERNKLVEERRLKVYAQESRESTDLMSFESDMALGLDPEIQELGPFLNGGEDDADDETE